MNEYATKHRSRKAARVWADQHLSRPAHIVEVGPGQKLGPFWTNRTANAQVFAVFTIDALRDPTPRPSFLNLYN